MNIKSSHRFIIAGQLMTFAALIGGLEHGWHDALTPMFVAAVIMQLATLISALAGEPIQGRTVWTPEQRAERHDPQP